MRHLFAEEPNGLLVVGDLDGELLPGLQTRIKTSGVCTGCSQILAGRREGTLRYGMSDRAPGDDEGHGGAICRSEVRRIVHQFTTGCDLDKDVSRVARRYCRCAGGGTGTSTGERRRRLRGRSPASA